MSGAKLTDKTVLADNPAQDDLLMVVDVSDTTGSANGTSKRVVSDYLIASEEVTISNPEFLLLATTGKKIVEKKGTGKAIIPLAVYCEYTEGGTPNTAGLTPSIGYVDGDANYYWDQQRFAFDSPTYNGISWVFSGGNPSAKGVNSGAKIADLDLFFYFTGAPTPASTGVIKVWTTYRVLEIS